MNTGSTVWSLQKEIFVYFLLFLANLPMLQWEWRGRTKSSAHKKSPLITWYSGSLWSETTPHWTLWDPNTLPVDSYQTGCWYAPFPSEGFWSLGEKMSLFSLFVHWHRLFFLVASLVTHWVSDSQDHLFTNFSLHSSVQFGHLTDWAVRGIWGTIQ